MISPQLEPEGITMDLTPNSNAASVSSAGSQSESEIEIDYEMMVGTTSSPSPFGAKSLIKSTEMALNVGAKSLMVSSSNDVFMKEQNKTNYCCDTAIENCLACSMIPEDFVEKVLCRMDKTLCTCQVTDWVDSTSNFCGVKKNKPTVLLDDSLFSEGTETESLTGSMCSFNGSLLDDEDEDEEDEIFNSMESEIPLFRHTHFQQKEKMDPPVTHMKPVEEKPKEKKKKKFSLWSLNTERVKDKKNEKTIENVVDNTNEITIENIMDNEEEEEKEEVKGTAQNFSFDFDTGEEMLTEKRIETVLDNGDDANSEDADDSNCEIMVTGLPSSMNPYNIFASSSANNEVTATRCGNIVDKAVEIDSEEVIKMAVKVSEYIADEVEVDNEKRIERGVLNDDVDDENDQEQGIAKKIDKDVNNTKCDVVPISPPFHLNPFNLFKSTKENMTNTVEGDKKNIETMLENEEESKNEDVGGDDTSTTSSIMDSINLFKATIEDTTNTEEGDRKNIEAMLNNEEELKNEHGDDSSITSYNCDQEMTSITDKMTTDTVSNNSDQETASIMDNKRTAPQLSPKIDNGDSMINNKVDVPYEKEEENEDDESGFECVLQRKIKSLEEEKKEKSKPFAPFSPPKTMEEDRMIQPIVTPSPDIAKKKKKSRMSRLINLSEKGKLSFSIPSSFRR
ncbi:hypothetical protein FRACYDRAFT_241922 [Fragilariopsis cylindrus CCMP1102]|uniref:Uncharacterized protein n=1 Tax=Fragilariopsis cylindrus CCMP1102 TaxID=635003 RepID=A0A1E7F6V1_9STRA|nr:hypothetical protein FRACYDRAFT_241922 [Fragilariopsis cylindrus CCMP1102]|eukprot:OEU13583.1 hypothetical protein FRACYDRAFT_241922 [Fragilariopsis cylindrus CCMP1102]